MSNTNQVRPSRDGDQFHYLWAARRCLKLLAPQTELVAISIEGSSPDERSSNTTALAGEDLIDIAEYFGSEDVVQATAVRYMQLKHSTLQTTSHWTASGLEKTLSGFAERYKELSVLLPAGAVSKVEFWFVTNRPISTDVTEAVEDAANGVTPRHPAELTKLERFTGLSGTSLSEFCQRIRFEASQDDYWTQRNILSADLAGYLPDVDVDAPTQLKELVTRKALSESETEPVITRADVLRVLKTDETLLFPAECLNKAIPGAIPRDQEAALGLSIVDASHRPVVVHALAGVGKSVFATRIAGLLPSGSHAVLYDCFGNGQYRSATGYRHRHRDGLVQIANELAGNGLCHPLIPTPHADDSLYLRAFLHRLRQAVAVLQHTEPRALLCIIIDAADNAQLAAEELGEARSFPRDLLREKLPDGVRLVVLCRTHRQERLDPPASAMRLELQPFSREETASHLRSAHPTSTHQDVEEFHRLSSQNPRVQALALSRKLPLPETLRKLGPNPTTVEGAIGTLLSDAIAKIAESVGPVEREPVGRICAGLATLRPLIPISVLSSISGVPEAAIRTFALELGRPLHVAGDTIQFYDEPAETWFREQFRPGPGEIAEFVRRLRPLATTSAYVAATLPQLMLEAGQFNELVELALTSTGLPETNQLVKRDVELQRLHFALKASLRTSRLLDATKLALKAGDRSAGDARQRKTIQDNTDLAARFLDAGVIQDLVSRRSFGGRWIGSHHVYEAGLLSVRAELRGDARSRLRMAGEWLRNWSRLPDSEREEEPISDADIAELALAHLNIHGAEAAAYSLRGWSPREVSFRVGRRVARRLIEHGRFTALDELAVASGNNLCLALAILVELRSIQRTAPAHVVRRAFRLASHSLVRLTRSSASDTDESVLDAITTLVEATLASSLCERAEASALLARYLPNPPPRGLSSRYSHARAPLLRAYCLKAALDGSTLQVSDLAHPELKAELEGKKGPHSTSQEVREFKEDVGALLPWYQLRAATLLGDVLKEAFPDALSRAREASSRSSTAYYRDRFHTSNEIVLVWFETLHRVDALDDASLDVLTKWVTDLKQPLFIPTLTSLTRLGGTKDATKALAIRFAANAFALLREEREDAGSKATGYIDIARAVLAISASDAKAYFNEALDVSEKIGEENHTRWEALLDLADRAARPAHPVPEAAYQFARCAELTRAHVDRDKHFDFTSTVRALAGLCPCSALAILSRWRDRDFGQSSRLLPIAIGSLIERGAVDALDVLPLIGFAARWDFVALAGHVLDRCVDRNEKQAAATFLHRYMSWDSQTASTWNALRKVVTKHAVLLPDLDAAIAFAESEERAAAAQKAAREQKRSVEHDSEGAQPDWDAIFAGVDLTTVAGISKARLAFENAPRATYSGHFLAHALTRLAVGSEPAFIEAVGEAPDFDLYDLRALLDLLPDAWRGRPAITASLRATLKNLCRRYCMKVSRNRYYEVLPFEKACSLAETTETDLIDVVLSAIAESPHFANSDRLFSLVGLLARKLTHEQALEGLTFGLSLLSSSLTDDDGDGPWATTLAPPATIHESIAGYIWAGLAAPAARLRWEAAHAVVGLCTLDRQNVLGRLVTFADRKSGGPFVDSRLRFYDLHGLQWLLIALGRAAEESPAPLAPFGARLVAWALRDQDHVMIRRFAAHTARILLARGLLASQDDVGERLARVNHTALPVIESKSYSRVSAKNASIDDDDDRFRFGIDIGPYWYTPLGRVFALSERDIEREALKVIRSEFGWAGRGRWDDDERARRKIFEGEDSYHSHGSYPRVDDLHFYLSYHAMMIVAGRLLTTTQVHHDVERDGEDDFAEWLSRHDLSRRDGRWLSDRRDPTPLERPAWLERKRDDACYAVVTPADFDEAFRSGELLNVWGHWTSSNSERVQSVRVQSALVSPDRSFALVRALSTAKNVHDYCIPSVDSDLQIDETGYVLRGWITDPHSDRGLDGKDGWSGGVNYPPPMPASYIVELLAIQPDLDNRCWREATGRVVISSAVWGHLEERDDDGNPERGERLQAPLAFVKDLLRNLGQDLIVGVEIERRRRDRRYGSRDEDERERVPATARLYLVRADGSVSTL